MSLKLAKLTEMVWSKYVWQEHPQEAAEAESQWKQLWVNHESAAGSFLTTHRSTQQLISRSSR